MSEQHEAEHGATTTEALALFTRFLEVIQVADEETIELVKLALTINHPAIYEPRRVYSVVTICPKCGSLEKVYFTHDFYEQGGKFVDVLAAMLELMGRCPECEPIENQENGEQAEL